MKRETPAAANGEGFEIHRADDDRGHSTPADQLQIPRVILDHWWRISEFEQGDYESPRMAA